MSPSMERPLFLPQCEEYRNGDVCQMADPRTICDVPWAGNDQYRMGEVLCETRWLPDYEPQAACPR